VCVQETRKFGENAVVSGVCWRMLTYGDVWCVQETRKFGENAASPFAWWRASFRGASTPHDAESTVLSLIADMEAALKEAVQQR
jgi:predicted type IV restriction endonuclease